ncbi:PIR Superfamily Protein [Plasmodium ovale curtisi]|uniref:PIR Superfamily Protein n=1 Tax=Plasmodium ovale curtisi TaxID=864141 RepID=A0A1A8X2C6_PLAOA|nr:PIR Superfamily Protein [Plasmodium ovale curtisi]
MGNVLYDLNEDDLPSNVFKKKLLQRINISELEVKCNDDRCEQSNIENYLRQLNPNLYYGYHGIKSQCVTTNVYKCCRNLNYYLDLIVGYIRSSKCRVTDKDDLVKFIENHWRDNYFNTGKLNECKREKDKYSTEKRCILKHLYDYCEDKNYLEARFPNDEKLSSQYNDYLQKKWNTILKYTISKENIKFSINNGDLKEDITYRDFFLKTDESIFNKCHLIKEGNLTVSHINIKTADEELTGSDQGNTFEQSQYQAIQPDSGSSISPRMEIFLSVGITLCSILTFFILYKFSPLRSYLHSYIGKYNPMEKNFNDNESYQLMEDYESKEHFVQYHSLSH